MPRQHRDVSHSTGKARRPHITSPPKSAVPWPPTPLVEWPLDLLDLYFETLLAVVLHEGAAQ